MWTGAQSCYWLDIFGCWTPLDLAAVLRHVEPQQQHWVFSVCKISSGIRGVQCGLAPLNATTHWTCTCKPGDATPWFIARAKGSSLHKKFTNTGLKNTKTDGVNNSQKHIIYTFLEAYMLQQLVKSQALYPLNSNGLICFNKMWLAQT